MNNKYTVAELRWSESPDSSDEFFLIYAKTPFGSYTVAIAGGAIRWGYCFDKYYDEGWHECESVEDGKAKAWNHWREKLASALNPA